MQAIFRPNGDREIVVSNQAEGVLIEMYEGLDPKAYATKKVTNQKVTEPCPACAKINAESGQNLAACANDPVTVTVTEQWVGPDGQPMPERRQTLVHLSKADARSVASAIMGAAAAL